MEDDPGYLEFVLEGLTISNLTGTAQSQRWELTMRVQQLL